MSRLNYIGNWEFGFRLSEESIWGYSEIDFCAPIFEVCSEIRLAVKDEIKFYD